MKWKCKQPDSETVFEFPTAARWAFPEYRTGANNGFAGSIAGRDEAGAEERAEGEAGSDPDAAERCEEHRTGGRLKGSQKRTGSLI